MTRDPVPTRSARRRAARAARRSRSDAVPRPVGSPPLGSNVRDAGRLFDPAHQPTRRAEHGPDELVARNAPCPCRSGQKFKRCHGRSPWRWRVWLWLHPRAAHRLVHDDRDDRSG